MSSLLALKVVGMARGGRTEEKDCWAAVSCQWSCLCVSGGLGRSEASAFSLLAYSTFVQFHPQTEHFKRCYHGRECLDNCGKVLDSLWDYIMLYVFRDITNKTLLQFPHVKWCMVWVKMCFFFLKWRLLSTGYTVVWRWKNIQIIKLSTVECKCLHPLGLWVKKWKALPLF